MLVGAQVAPPQDVFTPIELFNDLVQDVLASMGQWPGTSLWYNVSENIFLAFRKFHRHS